MASVSAEGRVDRTTITVGDSIRYTLAVRRGERDRVVLPEPGARFGDLEVRSVGQTRARSGPGGAVQETTDYLLTSYQVGSHEIPALAVGYTAGGGDTGHVATRPVRIEVRSVIRPGEERTLRDVKPPVDLPAGFPWWAWVLVLLALAGLAAWWILRRRKASPAAAPASPPRPIDELGEFDRIAEMGLLAMGEYKRHYALVADALRRYIERRYGIEAMERTTWEIVVSMRQAPLERPTVATFEAFLSGCDLVKFAKYIPPPEEMEKVVGRAKAIVSATMLLPDRPAQTVRDPEPEDPPGARDPGRRSDPVNRW